jgi:hypothetical protein
MTETSTTTIPAAGQWIRTDHHCWWNDATAEHPATLHNAPIRVARVVKLNTGFRIEAIRCDGSAMHLVTDQDGQETLQPWDAAKRGYQIVPAPEQVSA